jgi:hypothetical protein
MEEEMKKVCDIKEVELLISIPRIGLYTTFLTQELAYIERF